MGVDVVIVNWNGGPGLLRAVKSAQAFGGTPIVVDNASSDGVIDEVARMPGVVVLRHDRNRGFATAANTGAAAGMGEFVMLLNPDTEIIHGTATDLGAQFASSDAVLLGIGLARADGSPIPTVRGLPSGRDLVVDLLRSHALKARIQGADAGLPGTRPRGAGRYVVGSAIAMRRSDWEHYGGLDEGYFVWYEDIDLGARVHRSGDSVAATDAVVVRHLGTNSLATLSRRRRQSLRIASALRYSRRNLGLRASALVVANAPAAMIIGVADDVAHAAVDIVRFRRSRHAAGDGQAGEDLPGAGRVEVHLPD